MADDPRENHDNYYEFLEKWTNQDLEEGEERKKPKIFVKTKKLTQGSNASCKNNS